MASGLEKSDDAARIGQAQDMRSAEYEPDNIEASLLKRLGLSIPQIPVLEPDLNGLPHKVDVAKLAGATNITIQHGCGRFHISSVEVGANICIPAHFSRVDSNIAVVKQIASLVDDAGADDALANVLTSTKGEDRLDLISAGLMIRTDDFEKWSNRVDDTTLCYLFDVPPSIIRARKILKESVA